MYRRYIIVWLVFFLLIGAYFVFFDKDKNSNEYNKYYKKLVNRDDYEDSLSGVTLTIDEIEEEGKYSYIITFDNVSVKNENVKILVVSKDISNKYFPSFGIVDNIGYSLVEKDKVCESKEKKGINLVISDSEKIENLYIYYSSNGNEQFVNVKVVNYLK